MKLELIQSSVWTSSRLVCSNNEALGLLNLLRDTNAHGISTTPSLKKPVAFLFTSTIYALPVKSLQVLKLTPAGMFSEALTVQCSAG